MKAKTHIAAHLLKYQKVLIIAAIALVSVITTVLVVCSIVVGAASRYILRSHDTALEDKHIDVGLVLGAGVTKDGKPFKELQARLDTAADALKTRKVEQLLLSGDNRFVTYNEPSAMRRYLIEKHNIPEEKLHVDYAGRSTYESCERAAKIFGLKRTVIFSAQSHLPRAVYLCRHFGVETYGISSGVEANNSWRREVLARVKAVFNMYIYGEKTLLGKPMPLH